MYRSMVATYSFSLLPQALTVLNVNFAHSGQFSFGHPRLPWPAEPIHNAAGWPSKSIQRLRGFMCCHGKLLARRKVWIHRFLLGNLSYRTASFEEENAYALVLRRCCESKDLAEGKRVHLDLVNAGYDAQRYLGNLLMQMYGNCNSVNNASMVFQGILERNIFSWNILLGAYAQNGHLQEARRMFDNLPQRDVVSWTCMITAYAQAGQLQEAKSVFDEMPCRNAVSWSIVIQAYAEKGHLGEAKIILDSMPLWSIVCWTSMIVAYAENGHFSEASNMFDAMPQRNLVSSNAMITAYARKEHLEKARNLFDEMPEHDVVSGTALIIAYARGGHLQEARTLLSEMPERDIVSCTAMLTAYAESGYLEEARSLFEKLPEWNVVAWTAIVTAYAQNGHLEESRILFEKMPERDVVSWNAMIVANACEGHMQKAKEMFDEMPIRDAGSWNAIISAYATNEQSEEAKSLFDKMPETDAASWNALLTAYADTGHLQEAKSVFDEMPCRNLLAWTSIVQAYSRNAQAKEALVLFRLMDLEGVQADTVAFVSALDVCTTHTELAQGRLLHSIINDSLFKHDVAIASALINMYGKCGSMKDAMQVFDETPTRSAICWNAMISAHSQIGQVTESLELLRLMVMEGVPPVYITFISILSACSHAGLLKNGGQVFVSVRGDHGIEPTLDHYRCIIDLLGRLGHLDKAEELINSMPFVPDFVEWRTLLAACRMHGDVDRATRAAECAHEASPESGAPYVLLSNVYSTTQSNKL